MMRIRSIANVSVYWYYVPLLLICFSCRQPVTTEESTEPASVVNNTGFLNSITFRDLKGEPVDSNLYKNKVVILNLWATWCGPCIREMPDLEKMQELLPDNFVLLLASDEDRERVSKFVVDNSYDLKFVRLDQSLESLGVYSLPTTFIIGTDGQLLETLVGAREWDSTEQIEQLKTYLK